MMAEFESPNPAQLRAARAFLGWSRPDLAKAAGISHETVNRAEGLRRHPAGRGALMKICAALDNAGVEFIPAGSRGPGLRLKEAHAPGMGSRLKSAQGLPAAPSLSGAPSQHA